MKRIICLVLALIFTIAFSSMAFAAGEDIVDENNPAAAPQNVQDEMYGEDAFEIPDEPIPEGGGDEVGVEVEKTASVDQATIEDADTPASGELVQTGGVPAYLFYAAGGVCILAAVILATRKSKENNAG